MEKLILKEWSNSYENSVDDLRGYGHKIIAVSKSGNGHIITYKHSKLTQRPRKGDLVEYYSNTGSNLKEKGIIQGTDKDRFCVIDHVMIKHSIISLGNVIVIMKRQLIPIKLFKYLD